jgi:hypothetical protein
MVFATVPPNLKSVPAVTPYALITVVYIWILSSESLSDFLVPLILVFTFLRRFWVELIREVFHSESHFVCIINGKRESLPEINRATRVREMWGL